MSTSPIYNLTSQGCRPAWHGCVHSAFGEARLRLEENLGAKVAIEVKPMSIILAEGFFAHDT